MKKSRIHKRGLASLSKERRKEIASMGGKAAHACGKANEFNTKTATIAGKKGGIASAIKRKLKK